MRTFIESLKEADYLHILLNPLPIYGLAMGTLALVIALLLRNRQAQLLSLGLILVSAAAAWPAYLSGEKAYNKVYLLADADGQEWLDTHMKRVDQAIYLFYALAAVALGAALVPIRIPKTALPLAILTLVLAMAVLGAGGWIAHAGGKVRHSEFRPVASGSSDGGEAAAHQEE
jgi:hypothetical protein